MKYKQIYIIVPETVQVTPGKNQKIVNHCEMVPGRLMAQCEHVGRKLQAEGDDMALGFEDITAIVLSVRNSKELAKVCNHLNEIKDNCVTFYGDTNYAFYGTRRKVLTALAVVATFEGEFDAAIDHLPLYGDK